MLSSRKQRILEKLAGTKRKRQRVLGAYDRAVARKKIPRVAWIENPRISAKEKALRAPYAWDSPRRRELDHLKKKRKNINRGAARARKVALQRAGKGGLLFQLRRFFTRGK